MIARYLILALLALQAGYPASNQERSIQSIFEPVTSPGHQTLSAAMLANLVCTAIFVVVASLIAFTIVRFRRRPDDDNQEPPQVYGSNQIEAAWTVLPILIVFVLIMVTARVVASVQDTRPPAHALRARVVGHQWWWEINYPGYGVVSANELHIPVSGRDRQPTFLQLESADVAHDFWVAQLGWKMDVIPNRTNVMWFDPSETGIYPGNCAEYCGTQHANMLIRVYVQPKNEFDDWIQKQKAPANNDPSVAQQREVFESLPCVNCHAVRGTRSTGTFGPDLTHLMSRDTIASGLVRNTPENLKAWIRDPQLIKPGNYMPDMQLTNAQLDAVTAYLLTLK
jgi:cytochrome c oxidase subunit II